MKKSRDDKRTARRSNEKSLGTLHRAKRTKPRSPALTGKLQLQEHTLRTLTADLKQNGGGEVTCNMAAWLNFDRHGTKYVTVEISPEFKRVAPKSEADIFDIFDDDE
jgi:hypothetical protein